MKIKVLLSFALLLVSIASYSQPKPPPSHGSNTSQSNPQSAPIGTSTILLIALGASYTSIKIYSDRKDNQEEE
ncbi:MAG: hypothetical protein PHO12_08160 [Bacteroidales bacterium]|nr:hypothetical protein [Bacteroidales bacterium]MDD4683717.1 hypothetical protein [Bacteroidales bacterium]